MPLLLYHELMDPVTSRDLLSVSALLPAEETDGNYHALVFDEGTILQVQAKSPKPMVDVPLMH